MDQEQVLFDEETPDAGEADIVWDRDTIFIAVWFVIVLIVMSGILIIMWLKTKAYKTLGEHKRKVGRNHKLNPGTRPTKVIGFFHPNCADGAGGEKVLWQAVKALQNYVEVKENKYNIQILIYSNSKLSAEEIITKKVKERFGIEVSSLGLYFIQLDEKLANGLNPKNHPTLTLVWQALASIRVSIHSQFKMPCDIFVDTVGVGYSFPFLKLLFPCNVYAYVHYPFVSQDMVNVVASGTQQFNNKQTSFASRLFKIVYYNIMIILYKFCGRFADMVACNSSWTRGHIDSLWSPNLKICRTIFPPCDTGFYIKSIRPEGGRREIKGDEMPKETVEDVVKQDKKRQNLLVSFAQFRPEKDHALQLRVWSNVLKDKDLDVPKDAKFIMIGAVRGPDDEKIVDDLKKQAKDLGILDRVDFKCNLPRNDILDYFSVAKVGMHTMRDEHFGIAVVELMASGIITIAHNSAGPRKDILGVSTKRIGFLAEDEAKYTKFVGQSMVNFETEEYVKIRLSAREYVHNKFSQDSFNDKFQLQIQHLF